jgi:hypothetical protein
VDSVSGSHSMRVVVGVLLVKVKLRVLRARVAAPVTLPAVIETQNAVSVVPAARRMSPTDSTCPLTRDSPIQWLTEEKK